MSGYIIEEPETCPVYYNNEHEENEEYWRLYSPLQRKRFKKVLYQFRDTWYSIYNIIETLRNTGGLNIESSNYVMGRIHRMFIVEHRNKTQYYNEEKIRQRKQKGYLSKKISKLKNAKSKL